MKITSKVGEEYHTACFLNREDSNITFELKFHNGYQNAPQERQVAMRKKQQEEELAIRKQMTDDPEQRLMEEIKKGHIHVVVTRDAAMIARDWKQFLEFMRICDRANVDVVSINREADAWEQYSRIRQFIKDYFGEEALA